MELIQAKGFGNNEEIARSLDSKNTFEIEQFCWQNLRPFLTGLENQYENFQ
jgi:hypothetical protein